MNFVDDVGNKGLSFVVCCHNSADLMGETLRCLARQDFQSVERWEILIVDNASTDSTVDVAQKIWAGLSCDLSKLRIVDEPRLGVAYARYTGIKAASYDYICFVDDDNWLDARYAETAFNFMEEHSDVAACGSLNDVASKDNLPRWFNDFQRSFAVGPQSEEEGDITWQRGVLWSAGMVLRRSAIMQLLSSGFEPIVTGAQGNLSLLRSEDYELCLALRLNGWKLWYLPSLKLRHYMSAERLSWSYLKKLIAGVGASDPGLYPYYVFNELKFRSNLMIWLRFLILNFSQVLKTPRMSLLHSVMSFEGDGNVLKAIRAKACLRTLLVERKSFMNSLDNLRNAKWAASHSDNV